MLAQELVVTCCVVQNRNDVDVCISSSMNSIVQHFNSVLSNHARAIERFSPRYENADVDPALSHRKREGETQWQILPFQVPALHEIVNALGQEIKQVDSGTKAHILWHLVVLDFLTNHSTRLDTHENDSEIGPSQVQCQIVSLFWNSR